MRDPICSRLFARVLGCAAWAAVFAASVSAFAGGQPMSPEDAPLIDVAKSIWDAARNGQWFLLAALIVVVVVRVARAPLEKYWDKWPMWVRRVFIALVSFAGAFAVALMQGLPLTTALAAGLPIFVAAIFGHKATQAAGSALTIEGAKPSVARWALDPLLPVDREKISLRTSVPPPAW
jgi:hypothetical protein